MPGLEIIQVIYDLLETDYLAVREAWTGHFPDRELERMANAFGVTFAR